MSDPVLSVVFPSPDEFLSAYENEVSNGGLLVRTQQLGLSAGKDCVVRVEVGALQPVDVEARVAAVARFGVSVVFDERPVAIDRLALSLQAGGARSTSTSSPRLRPPPAPPTPNVNRTPAPGSVIYTPISTPMHNVAGPPAAQTSAAPTTLQERLAALTPGQKMSAALAGERNVRISLLRDLNKTIHTYVLRNPRIGLDEVQWAAKQTTLSSEALQSIGEHGEWGRNPGIAAALVRNPKVPLPVALRLLSNVPPYELRAIAKGGARDQIVQAARKMLAG